MVLHVAKGSFSDDVAHISFPTEVDKVRNEVIAVEEFGSWAPAYVIGGATHCSAKLVSRS